MPQIDIKIQSIADLAALKRAIDEVGKGEAAVKRFNQEGAGLGEIFRLGFGIGSGIELARRALDLFKSTVIDTARESFAMAGQIKDGAEALGVTRQAYQVLGQVMEDAGGKQERMSQAIEKNNRSLLEARTQAGPAAEAYRTLGLSAAALEALPVPRRMEVISRAIMGAADQTAAFGAAGDILGSKNLPVLLNALRALGTEGYDALAEKMEKAGKIMSDDTIERLEKAQKAIDSVKRSMTIGVGESIAAIGLIKDAAQKDFGATLIGVIKASLLGDYTALGAAVAKNVPIATGPKPADTTAESALALANEKRLIDLKGTKLKLLQNELDFDNAQKSVHLTDEEKRAAEISYLDRKWDLLGKIYSLTAATPLDGTDPAKRAEDLARLNAQQQGAGVQRANIANPLSDAAQRNNKFDSFNSGLNAQGGPVLSPADALTAGIQDAVIQYGQAGDQIAAGITSTIGAAVTGISDGIYGWITGTQSAGQVVLQFARTALKTALDTVIQIGVQQLINGNIFRTVMLATDALSNALRIGRVAKDNAAEAATLPLKTAGAAAAGISSYGVALAFGAIAIALIAAAAGGFESGGYTSPGPSDRPAGIVHAGEWVAPQWMAKDPVYGPVIQSLEGARQGVRGFKTGGWLGKLVTTGIDDKFLSFFQTPGASTKTLYDERTDAQRAITDDFLTPPDSLTAPAYQPSASGGGSSIGSRDSSGGSGSSQPIFLSVANFDDRPSMEQWIQTQAGRSAMINFLRENGVVVS